MHTSLQAPGRHQPSQKAYAFASSHPSQTRLLANPPNTACKAITGARNRIDLRGLGWVKLLCLCASPAAPPSLLATIAQVQKQGHGSRRARAPPPDAVSKSTQMDSQRAQIALAVAKGAKQSSRQALDIGFGEASPRSLPSVPKHSKSGLRQTQFRKPVFRPPAARAATARPQRDSKTTKTKVRTVDTYLPGNQPQHSKGTYRHEARYRQSLFMSFSMNSMRLLFVHSFGLCRLRETLLRCVS